MAVVGSRRLAMNDGQNQIAREAYATSSTKKAVTASLPWSSCQALA
ncbi:MAG: hypothetical protein M0Z39_00905 [Actinomycetota bacterium]|nr:hypothetical protein [Actinomycetota bacterium]